MAKSPLMTTTTMMLMAWRSVLLAALCLAMLPPPLAAASLGSGCPVPVLSDFTVTMASASAARRILKSTLTADMTTAAITCDGNQTGSTCSIECQQYYDSNIHQRLVCGSDGLFSGSFSNGCVSQECSSTPALASLSAAYANTYVVSESGCAGKQHGELCELECLTGETVSVGTVECIGNTWEMAVEPVCRDIRCSFSELPTINFGKALCAEVDAPFEAGDVCAVQCDDGYTLSGELRCHDGSFKMYGGIGCVQESSSKNTTAALVATFQFSVIPDSDGLTDEATISSTLELYETVFGSDSSADLGAMLISSLASSKASAVKLAVLLLAARTETSMFTTALQVGIAIAKTDSELAEVGAALMEYALKAGLPEASTLEAMLTSSWSLLGSSLSVAGFQQIYSGITDILRLKNMLYLVNKKALLRPASWQHLSSTLVPTSRHYALEALQQSARTGVGSLGVTTAANAFLTGSFLAASALTNFELETFSEPSAATLSSKLAQLGGSNLAWWRVGFPEANAAAHSKIATLMVEEQWVSLDESPQAIFATALPYLLRGGLSRVESISISTMLAMRATSGDGSALCTTDSCYYAIARSVGSMSVAEGITYNDLLEGVYTAGWANASGPVLEFAFTSALAAMTAHGQVDFVFWYLPYYHALYQIDEETQLWWQHQATATGEFVEIFKKFYDALTESPGDYILTSHSGKVAPSRAEVAIAIQRVLPLNPNIYDAINALAILQPGDNSLPLQALHLGLVAQDRLLTAESAAPWPPGSQNDTYNLSTSLDCLQPVLEALHTSASDSSAAYLELLAGGFATCHRNPAVFDASEEVLRGLGYWTAADLSTVSEVISDVASSSATASASGFFSVEDMVASRVQSELAAAHPALVAISLIHQNVEQEWTSVTPAMTKFFEAQAEMAVAETLGGTLLDKVLEAVLPYNTLALEELVELVKSLADYSREDKKPHGSSVFSTAFVAARVARVFNLDPYHFQVDRFSFRGTVAASPVFKGRTTIYGNYWYVIHCHTNITSDLSDSMDTAFASLETVYELQGEEAELFDFVTGSLVALADDSHDLVVFAAAVYDVVTRCSRAFSFLERIEIITAAATKAHYADYMIPLAVGVAVAARPGTYEADVSGAYAVHQAITTSIALSEIATSRAHQTDILAEVVGWGEVFTNNISTARNVYYTARTLVETVAMFEEYHVAFYLASLEIPFVPPRKVVASTAASLANSDSDDASSTTLEENPSTLILAVADALNVGLSSTEAQGAMWFASSSLSYERQKTFNLTIAVGREWGLSVVDAALSAAVLALTQAVSVEDVQLWVVAWTKDHVASPSRATKILGLLSDRVREFEAVTGRVVARGSLSEGIRSGDGSNWPLLRTAMMGVNNVEDVDFAVEWPDSTVEQLLVALLQAGHEHTEVARALAKMDATSVDHATKLARALIANDFGIDELETLLSAFSSTIRSSAIATVSAQSEALTLFPPTPKSKIPSLARRLASNSDEASRALADSVDEDVTTTSTTTTTTSISSSKINKKWAAFYLEQHVRAMSAALEVDADRIYVTAFSDLSASRRLAAEVDADTGRALASTSAQGYHMSFVVTGVEDPTALVSAQEAVAGLSEADSSGSRVHTFSTTLQSLLSEEGITVPASFNWTIVSDSDSSGVVSQFQIPISVWEYEEWAPCDCGKYYWVHRSISCSSGLIAACEATHLRKAGQARPNTTKVCNTECPYSCPYGDRFIIECPDQELSTILASIAFVLLIICLWCVVMCRRPRMGQRRIELAKLGRNEVVDDFGNIKKRAWSKWRFAGRLADRKEHIVWDLDWKRVAQAMGVSADDLQADLVDSNFILNTNSECLGSQIDLGFAGDSYELTLKLQTTSNRATDFVCGKVYLEGSVPEADSDESGSAISTKALLLSNGYVVFEMEQGRLACSRPINDGQKHDITVKFDKNESQVTLLVDGKQEGYAYVGDCLSVDHPESFWLTATSIAKPSLEDTPSRRNPLSTLIGKVSDIKYKGKTVRDPTNGAATARPKGYTLVCKEAERTWQARRSTRKKTTGGVSAVSVNNKTGAYKVQSKLEYFSVTHGRWVMCSIQNYQAIQKPDGLIELRHNLQLRQGTKRLGVTGAILRMPLRPGEPCSTYSVSHGKWIPAFAARSQLENVGMWGYRVFVERELDKFHANEQELQRQVEAGVPVAAVAMNRQLCPVRKAAATTIRRRFAVGASVLVFKENEQTWVPAKVQAIRPVRVENFLPESMGGRGDLTPRTIRRRLPEVDELPDLPIAWIEPPRPKDDSQSPRESVPGLASVSRAVSVRSAATSPRDRSSPRFDNSSPMARESTRRSRNSTSSQGRAAGEGGGGVPGSLLPLALWETATVQEDDGDPYEVETYWLRMQPQAWGHEAHLPTNDEELAMILKSGIAQDSSPTNFGEAVLQSLSTSVSVTGARDRSLEGGSRFSFSTAKPQDDSEGEIVSVDSCIVRSSTVSQVGPGSQQTLAHELGADQGDVLGPQRLEASA